MSDPLRNNSLYTHRGSGEQVIIREVSNGTVFFIPIEMMSVDSFHHEYRETKFIQLEGDDQKQEELIKDSAVILNALRVLSKEEFSGAFSKEQQRDLLGNLELARTFVRNRIVDLALGDVPSKQINANTDKELS